MAGVNKVILVGNLGADPEVKHLEGDKVVANLRLATTEAYKDKMGNRVENTEWHDLELWDGQAKIAEQYLNEKLREKYLGDYSELSKILLTNHMKEWLDKEAKTRVKAKTYQNYADLVNYYIEPALGEIMLSDLSAVQIKDLYNEMIEDGLSPKTVKNVHGVLSNTLKQAVIWGRLRKNPAEQVTLPRKQNKEMPVLSKKQSVQFLEEIVYSKWKALFSLLITTGMRPGEALGLRWRDIDFEGERISINRSLSRVGKSWSLEEPKNQNSRRSIPVSSIVLQDLNEHKEIQDEEKSELEEGGYKDYDFVFANQYGEPLAGSNILKRHLKPILQKAGLPPITLYGLRHTCATLLLSAGEHEKIVSERLGHKSIVVTMDVYSHVLPDMQKTAVKKLDDILFNDKD